MVLCASFVLHFYIKPLIIIKFIYTYRRTLTLNSLFPSFFGLLRLAFTRNRHVISNEIMGTTRNVPIANGWE